MLKCLCFYLLMLVSGGHGACCPRLRVHLNFAGKHGLAYNRFTGEYRVTTTYVHNGTFPVFQHTLKANLSLAHVADTSVRYGHLWAFYDNENQPVGDKHALLFLGVTPFGCPESFTVGTPPDIGPLKPSLRYYNHPKSVFVNVSQSEAKKFLTIECVSSPFPRAEWAHIHSHITYPCKNGKGSYQFRCLANGEYSPLGGGCNPEALVDSDGCCWEVSFVSTNKTHFPFLAPFLGVYRQDGTRVELESDIFSHSNEIVKLNKSRPVYRKDDDDNLFLSQAEYYLMGWQWWMGGKPFFQAGRMDGRIVVWNGGSCPNNIRVDTVIAYDVTHQGWSNEALFSASRLGDNVTFVCGYNLS